MKECPVCLSVRARRGLEAVLKSIHLLGSSWLRCTAAAASPPPPPPGLSLVCFLGSSPLLRSSHSPSPGFVPLFALPSKARERGGGGDRERRRRRVLGVSKRHRRPLLLLLLLQQHSLYCGLYCLHSHFPHRTHSAWVTWPAGIYRVE